MTVVLLRYAAVDTELAQELQTEAQVGTTFRFVSAEDDSTADYTLFLNPAHLAEEQDLYALLAQERVAGRRLIAWITDDPLYFDANYPLPSLFDYVFTNDSNAALYYHSERVHFLPSAASALEAPIVSQKDTLIVAENSPADQSFVETVRAALPAGTAYDILTEAEAVPMAAEYRVVIRYPRFVPGERNTMFQLVPSTPDLWTFTLASQGVCQVIFLRQPELRDYFTSEEIATFDTPESLRAVLAALDEEKTRQQKSEAARATVHAGHLWRHRLEQIADILRDAGVLA
jgi:hypothetical protein